jgi:hypothetical protein
MRWATTRFRVTTCFPQLKRRAPLEARLTLTITSTILIRETRYMLVRVSIAIVWGRTRWHLVQLPYCNNKYATNTPPNTLSNTYSTTVLIPETDCMLVGMYPSKGLGVY